jgi:hypothetical protein
MPQPLGRFFAIHPDDPSKIIRYTSDRASDAYDKEEMDEKVANTQHVLDNLTRHNVPHVNPLFIDETNNQGQPSLMIVVNRLTNVRSYTEDIISAESVAPDVAREADLVLERLFDCVDSAVQQGGYLDREMMGLGQFIYDDSRPVGQKMVLIDVEPIGARKVDPLEESIREGYPEGTCALSTTARLSVNAIRLAQKTSYPVQSLEAAARVIEMLPGNSENTNAAKIALLDALDKKIVSMEVLNLAMGEAMDSDAFADDDEGEDGL